MRPIYKRYPLLGIAILTCLCVVIVPIRMWEAALDFFLGPDVLAGYRDLWKQWRNR